MQAELEEPVNLNFVPGRYFEAENENVDRIEEENFQDNDVDEAENEEVEPDDEPDEVLIYHRSIYWYCLPYSRVILKRGLLQALDLMIDSYKEMLEREGVEDMTSNMAIDGLHPACKLVGISHLTTRKYFFPLFTNAPRKIAIGFANAMAKRFRERNVPIAENIGDMVIENLRLDGDIMANPLHVVEAIHYHIVSMSMWAISAFLGPHMTFAKQG